MFILHAVEARVTKVTVTLINLSDECATL